MHHAAICQDKPMSEQTRCTGLFRFELPAFLPRHWIALPANGSPRGRIISGAHCSIGFGRTASQSTNAPTKKTTLGEDAAKTGRRGTFKPGQSGGEAEGNEKRDHGGDGSPDGRRKRGRKAIELAKAGDMTAIRLCMERILPPRKDRPVSFTLPTITSAKDALSALSALLTAVSTGELTPSEAAEVGKLVHGYVKATEINELPERLERLEKMMVTT
jgi:hypothetical protein